MKRENMIEDLEMFLIELLEKERFEFLEPYMEAGEGCPANTLIGNPAKEILDFLESRGMMPPRRVPELTKWGETNGFKIGEYTWEE